MHYLYRITDLTNGRVYIGQTRNLDQRWKCHRKGNLHVDKIMKSRGHDNFICEPIVTCQTLDQCNDLEEFLIKQYKCLISENGYNLMKGGTNKEWTSEMKKKISDTKKELAKTMTYSDETRKKLGDATRGVKKSQ